MLDIIKNFTLSVSYSEVITTVVIAALGTLIAKLRPSVKKLLNDTVKYITLQAKTSQYEDQLNKSYDIWTLVDENYRIGAAITEIFQSKADYFNTLLLEQFPSLTQSEIDYIRQVIAGNENYDKLTSDSKIIKEN